MKKKIYLFILLLASPELMAQESDLPIIKDPVPIPLNVEYEYDDAGNRTCKKIVFLKKGEKTSNDVTNINTSVKNSSFGDHNEQGEHFFDQLQDITVNIFPNPTTQKIFLKITSIENEISGLLKLYSMEGKFLREISVNHQQMEIDLSPYPSGMYIAKLRINGLVSEWKIIKQ